MKNKYYIESLTTKGSAGGEDIGKAVISCPNHRECIVVLGDKESLTDRVIAVIEGLNRSIK